MILASAGDLPIISRSLEHLKDVVAQRKSATFLPRWPPPASATPPLRIAQWRARCDRPARMRTYLSTSPPKSSNGCRAFDAIAGTPGRSSSRRAAGERGSAPRASPMLVLDLLISTHRSIDIPFPRGPRSKRPPYRTAGMAGRCVHRLPLPEVSCVHVNRWACELPASAP